MININTIPDDWFGNIAFGNSAKITQWTNKEVDLAALITGLTDHRVGTKDGPAILQGSTKDGYRKAASMARLDIIALDVDDGTPGSELDARIVARGLHGVRYSTHSHTPAKPKNRLVFILARPWIASNYTDHAAAARAWKQAYEAFAVWLGVSFDPACTDPSRLFYLPRHAEGAEFEVQIHGRG